MQDKAGRTLEPGDFIVYGHALGRCAGLRYGLVKEVKSFTDAWEKTQVRVRVRGVDDDWGHYEPNLLSKDSYLLFSKRILVIEQHQAPLPIRALLMNEWQREHGVPDVRPAKLAGLRP